MAEILVVDDEKNIIKSFQSLLSEEHRVYGASNRRKTLEIIGNQTIDVLFLDYNLSGENGLEILREVKKHKQDLCVVMISGQGNFEVIIQAMAMGAYDYLEKPLDIDKIQVILNRVLKTSRIEKVINFMVEEQSSYYSLNRIIGKSEAMQGIFKQIGLLLNKDISVLITGENGTGKELIARALHYGSRRKNEPFVAVNCSGLSESLLDNELFGHEKQAFTGADSRMIGKFEKAAEGTIFLDEIGEMPLVLQSKLLRVLQEREFHRLGGNKAVKMTARIIAATNVDIEREVENGQFRRDLFYRINATRLHVPPLKYRREDIPLMLDYFVSESNRKLNKKIKGLPEHILEKLMKYDWPGNVRELENTVTNMCIKTHGEIIEESAVPDYLMEKGSMAPIDHMDRFLSDFVRNNGEKCDLLEPLTEMMEQRLIRILRDEYNFNKSQIAEKMGISRVTLAKKMNRS
ncbi:sigma-54-dependent transcriptional regulator [Spirochaeta isovalerica]|uniref:DNA-binding transcriptional regulator NtrC n=1 Tax=Spirochaeta isovalerica TaxID=150 RepID=A0A841RFK6_9SPIO|nr:sigma-54 dependent transcriptional regulator [Spirochaeta isovalerica]MBB6482171.1 DNA-binding NtrC family response regulator [Spirochaeta isovalerica]